MSCIISWGPPILQSAIAGYLLLVIIKFIAFCRIRKFIGVYNHVGDKDRDVTFNFVFNKWSILSPILNISICIKRNSQNTVNQDWHGVFYSDILNPNFFKGVYIINNPGENDADGWLELTLFKYPKSLRRVAFHLHHLVEIEGTKKEKIEDIKKERWNDDGGYYIEKQ